MFTEIAETDPPTHARIHSTSMLGGRSMLGAQPALPAHLAHGHQPQGTCHQNTVCSVKNKPSWAGQGRQVPEQGAAHMSKPL